MNVAPNNSSITHKRFITLKIRWTELNPEISRTMSETSRVQVQGSSERRRPGRPGYLKPWSQSLKLLGYKGGVSERKQGIWKSRTARTSWSCRGLARFSDIRFYSRVLPLDEVFYFLFAIHEFYLVRLWVPKSNLKFLLTILVAFCDCAPWFRDCQIAIFQFPFQILLFADLPGHAGLIVPFLYQ